MENKTVSIDKKSSSSALKQLDVAEVFHRIKPYLIFTYFLIRYNLETGMPELSRSQHGPEENKTLHQAA